MRELVGVVVCVAVFGCTGMTGPAGANGAPGAAGERGAPGRDGVDGRDARPATSWVDAIGTPVGVGLEYVDDAGVFWPIDAETGTLNDAPTLLYFTAAGCAGEPVVSLVLPRSATPIDGGWYVRNDTATRQNVSASSYSNAQSQCFPANNLAGSGVPLSQFRSVAPPVVGFTPPLRRQLQ